MRMRPSNRRTVLATVVGVLGILLLQSPLNAAQYEAQQYERLLASAFGSPQPLPLFGSSEIAWRATVRVSPGLARPEYQLSFSKKHSGELQMRLISVDGPAIAESLRAALQEWSPEVEGELLSSVRLIEREREGTSADLGTLAERFESLRVPMTASAEMLMDPTTYSIWIDSGGRRFQLRMIGSTHGGDADPIIQWIATARDLCLSTCNQSSKDAGGSFR